MLNRSRSRSRFILPPFTYAKRRGWLKNGNPTGDPSTAPRCEATTQTLNLEFRIVSDTADWKRYEREIEDQFRNKFAHSVRITSFDGSTAIAIKRGAA
jgi:hypothetical protein